jgi:nicotinamide-nucleotide amidase
MSRPPSGDPGDGAAVVRVAIACIGTELTRGEIHNTNATWLAEQLTALGAEVTRIQAVADDADDIERCLAQAAGECRAVVVTGGLGPTTDDITSQSTAR